MTAASRPAATSRAPDRFGDLLALARLRWVGRMAAGLAALGYDGYRRSDAAVVRLLARGPRTVGGLGTALGVTRQAARKAVRGLERRGFATTARGEHDSRQVMVALTGTGVRYADAVAAVVDALHRDLAHRIDPAALTVAAAVLRAIADADADAGVGAAALTDHPR